MPKAISAYVVLKLCFGRVNEALQNIRIIKRESAIIQSTRIFLTLNFFFSQKTAKYSVFLQFN